MQMLVLVTMPQSAAGLHRVWPLPASLGAGVPSSFPGSKLGMSGA